MQLLVLSMMDRRRKLPIQFFKAMTFYKGLKKLFTTPVYLFGENTEKSEEQEEKDLFLEDEKGEVKWYDRLFSWPIFIITWILQIAVNIFLRPTQVNLGQKQKPRKLKTALSPLLSLLFFLSKVVLVTIVLIGLILLSSWIIIKFL